MSILVFVILAAASVMLSIVAPALSLESPLVDAVLLAVGAASGVLAVILNRRLRSAPIRADSGAVAGIPALRDALEIGLPGAERVGSLYLAFTISTGFAILPAAIASLASLLGSPQWVSTGLLLVTAVVWPLVFPRYQQWETHLTRDSASRLTSAST